jgi:UDP-glucose 4-epimerase
VRVLVTGATGLIGTHLVPALHARGCTVRAFQRNALEGVESVRGDVRTDREGLRVATSGCEAVVHLAGRGDVAESRRDPVGYAHLNAMGALHALEAARAANALFVLASSQRVYALQPGPCNEEQAPAPDSPYGYAKWAAELWCRMASEQFGVATRVLRFFSVYGPGQRANGASGVVSIFARAALAGAPLVVQSAGRRDFTDARDVARGILCAIDDGAARGGYRTYNVATGVGTSFSELAHSIVRFSGSRSTIEQRITEPPGCDLVANVGLARAELRFSATIPLEQGLQSYLQWLNDQSCS